MNYLGLTVFAGNTPGLILDFDPSTKEYTVEFTDGRVVKTASVFWDKTIPSEPDIAFYRQSSIGNGEQLVYDPEIGWDIVSAVDEIDIVDQPSDLGEWVDDYTADDKGEHSNIEEKLDEVLDTLNDLVEKDKAVHDKLDGEEDSAVQEQDHDATEDSYWDRSTKPNPMAYDEEFPSGNYNERNPGTLNPTAKTAKDCGCWDGYKRVPGTEPCAPGSCEKCDAARKKESAAKKKQSPDEAVKKVNTVPPAGVRAAAKRGLKYYEEGKAGDGFEAATADRARKIAAGEALTEEHINRMHSFFERHAGGRSKKAKPGEVTAWDVAWLCWGGDAGRSWAAKVDAQLHKARHPNSKGKHSADAGAGVLPKDYRNEDEIVLREPSGSDPERLLQKTRDLMTPDGQDSRGNAEIEFGEGGDEGETGMDRHVVHLDGVDFDPEILGLEDILVADFGDDEEEFDDEGKAKHSHIRAETDWNEKHFSITATCPNCSDPLIDYNCHSCGDNHKKHAKKFEKRAKALEKITKELKPHAEQLGILFGNALAGYTKDSTTEPSEDIFAVHLHGQDSDPSIGGTGGHNRVHGDSPELGKDVNGIGGLIDATPELLEKGMPVVIQLSESDESGEGNPVVKILEKLFDSVLKEPFKNKKEETKKEKNSSIKVSADNMCSTCGRYFVRNANNEGICNESNSPSPALAPSGCEAVGVDKNNMGVAQQGGHSVQNMPTKPIGVQSDVSRSSVDSGWSTAYKAPFSFRSSSVVEDSNGSPLEENQTYRMYSGDQEAPEIIRIESVDPEKISVSYVDDKVDSDIEKTEDIYVEDALANGTTFDKENIVNPVELDSVEVPATDGTPETMDDAGPGHNDIPGERDLSNAHEASVKESGRHYLPHQQKEFINESGSARNLDKLILEGTHYEDGEVTASDNFDDDFLFGV